MTNYLSYKFSDDEIFIKTFDELPLWSASFGLLMLKHLELKPDQKIIDIGSGAGFPLLELASRLGNSCKIYGVDNWINANKRAKEKIAAYEISNVEIMECSAESLSFNTNEIDLIVSNLGINNFENPAKVFKECNRVLKPKGKIAITTNINGHWKEFYSIFYKTLNEIGKSGYIDVLRKEEEYRGTTESISKLFTDNGFPVHRHFEESFQMNFLNGSAFLNHHFVKLGWLSKWMELFPKEELTTIFSALEANLNRYSIEQNGLSLTVPMAYFEGIKM
jgi:arsenite methyltransferase